MKAAADEKSKKDESEGGSMATTGTTEKSTEPYSVVTASSCEIIYLSRMAFCEIMSGGPIDEDDMDNFLKNQQYFPDDLDIKKKYFEENNW